MNRQELDEFLATKNYQAEISDELKRFGFPIKMDIETALKILKTWVVFEHNAKIANERVDYFRKKFNTK
jgi:hypothetical protein